MPGVSSTELRLSRPIPPKPSFADFDEPGLSLRSRTLKRLRIKTEEAEQEAKVFQYPLMPVND